ncbi:unnamed protein product [Periconia digitata]|uniref:Uncharacterized protein n=1 Tax=Periconia digitata TaxID=1303443 RepID=A0A9W4U6S8_9PLEO|nr:unnamed protein product [Periconia digitata]
MRLTTVTLHYHLINHYPARFIPDMARKILTSELIRMMEKEGKKIGVSVVTKTDTWYRPLTPAGSVLESFFEAVKTESLPADTTNIFLLLNMKIRQTNYHTSLQLSTTSLAIILEPNTSTDENRPLQTLPRPNPAGTSPHTTSLSPRSHLRVILRKMDQRGRPETPHLLDCYLLIDGCRNVTNANRKNQESGRYTAEISHGPAHKSGTSRKFDGIAIGHEIRRCKILVLDYYMRH